MKKYLIYHNIDGKKITVLNSDAEFLLFTQKIYEENEEGQPYPSEIYWLPENIQQAEEYISEYCSNLTLLSKADIKQFIYSWGLNPQWQIELNNGDKLNLTTEEAMHIEEALQGAKFEEIQDLKGRITYILVH